MSSKQCICLLLLAVVALGVKNMTFDEFIVKFNKNYTKGTEEYALKEKIFLVNVQELQQKDCEVCGITKFFDVAPKDFEKSNSIYMQRCLTWISPIRRFLQQSLAKQE